MVGSAVPRARLRPWLSASIAALLATLPSTALALQSYVVQPGDTLSRIAALNGVSVTDLARENGITDINRVNAGIELRIPTTSPAPATTTAPGTTRVVGSGDTLSAIADELGVDIATLAAANGIVDPSFIVVGQVLTVPSSVTPPAPETATATAPASTASTPVATAPYTVGAGDTLADIAARFGTDPGTLATLNAIENPSLIVVGQVLAVPATAPVVSPGATTPPRLTHIVVAGESLSMIADQYGVSVADLVAANTLTDPSLLVPGQTILVPAAIPAANRAEVRAILKSVETEFSLPDGLLQALAWQESGWQQQVVSGAGAIGITQVLPTTALWALQFLVQGAGNWQTSVLDNARVGGSYMKHLLGLTGGNVATAIAAYYQGLDSIRVHGLYDDTKQYVANVLALWPQFKS